MTKKFAVGLAFLAIGSLCHSQNHEYKVVRVYHIASPGGWDYIAVNNGKLYVSHSTQVNIMNEETGDSLGYIPNTTGVHGIAFDKELNKGYTSNGRLNNVTVFDLKTNETLGQISTGQNPDAIMHEPFTGMIITCNGRSKNLSIIDPRLEKTIDSIDVGGKPETAASDGNGKLFVNIEDKNEIVAVDLKKRTVVNHWSISPGEGPTGLAYDEDTKRLFAGCEKLLIVLNAESGAVVDKIVIGDGCDGVAFDSKKKIIYTSNGEGTLSAIKEISADKYSFLGNYPTKRGARTITINENSGTLYLPTAEFDPTKTGQNGRPMMIPGTFQVLVVQ
ncbi:MAG TPA: YncE family protein [Chitinophagaceae bacterium]|jgi:DNA-binding beta-propeller fold protein YncE|nr:YncE family protein [Chitinophagaceae bacterium]